jgi:hypothetical protein
VRVVFLGVRGSVCAPGPDVVRYGGNSSCPAISVDADSPPMRLLGAGAGAGTGTGIRTVTGMVAVDPFRGTIAVNHLREVEGLALDLP